MKILRLLEIPSVIIRGKAFIVVHQLVGRNTDMLLHACQNRLDARFNSLMSMSCVKYFC